MLDSCFNMVILELNMIPWFIYKQSVASLIFTCYLYIWRKGAQFVFSKYSKNYSAIDLLYCGKSSQWG